MISTRLNLQYLSGSAVRHRKALLECRADIDRHLLHS